MEVIVNVDVSRIESVQVKEQEKEFWSEFAEGLFWVEIQEKEEQLKEFKESFESLEDKDSFNGQYLEVLIDNLTTEIKEKKKSHNF